MNWMSLIITVISLSKAQAYASPKAENDRFSGVYKVESCTPSCNEIIIDKGQTGSSFAEISFLDISVVDQLEGWPTCDKKRPFEFNIRFRDSRSRPRGSLYHNNLGSGPTGQNDQICDGQFLVSSSVAELNSPSVGIRLANNGSSFVLKWKDNRLGFEGTIQLTKIESH